MVKSRHHIIIFWDHHVTTIVDVWLMAKRDADQDFSTKFFFVAEKAEDLFSATQRSGVPMIFDMI